MKSTTLLENSRIDRFHFSPDMGKYEYKNGKFYFETGLVIKGTNMIRSMPSDHGIKYSKWSKKKRKRMLKKSNEKT